MDNFNPPQQPPVPQTPIGMQPNLPNATAALVLGIISIPTCSCYGIPGMVCGILAIIYGSRAVRLYKANPGVYHISSYNNANAGKVCGIIGVSLAALFLLYLVIILIFWGTIMASFLSTAPWDQFK